MMPTFLDKVIATFLLSCACYFGPLSLSAQQRVFHFNAPPELQTSSVHTYLYKVPQQAVYDFCYDGRTVSPSEDWLQQPAYIIPNGATDSLLRLATVPAGHYLAVSAQRNQVQLRMLHKPAFTMHIHDLEHIKVLKVIDTNGRLLKDVTVKKGRRNIPFDPGMQGFVLKQRGAGIIMVSNKEDVGYMAYSVKSNRVPSYSGSSYYNSDHAKSNRFYKGYLVTNKPQYRPLDTVKWKAYLLDPQSGDRPAEEDLRVSFAADDYYGKSYVVSPAFKATASGVYFGEFIIGDSIKADQSYKLEVYGTRTAFRISQTFEVEDYLLKELNLRVTDEGRNIYQPGDSVHLYVYAYNSNNLPVADGRIEVTVFPDRIGQQAIDSAVFIPDTLFHTSIPVQADGETNAGFSTSGFPSVLQRFKVNIGLVNSNFERRDTVLYFDFTANKTYLKVSQDGHKLRAELIAHKKSVTGKGLLHVRLLQGSRQEKQVVFPYEHTIDEQDAGVSFVVLNDSGTTADVCYHTIERSVLSGDSHFIHDTAVLQLHNPFRVAYNYSIYRGNKFIGYGSAQSDTVIKVRSRKGQTVTITGAYTWQGKSHTRRFELVRRDKEMDIQISRQELVYPGQKDSISISLLDRKGNGIRNTNVTVLAFNSQFENDHVPDIPYGGTIAPAYTPDEIHTADRMELSGHRTLDVSKEWLSRCGADTQFFYKNLYLLPGNATTMIYDIPESVLPQMGIYLRNKGQYYKPEIIYIDGTPVYIRQAISTNLAAFFVHPGKHDIRIRMADAEYRINDFYIADGKKTDLYLSIDTSQGAYTVNNEAAVILPGVTYPTPGVVRRTIMPDTLTYWEQQDMEAVLLMYRNEGLSGPYGQSWGQLLFQQYPYEFNRKGELYSGYGRQSNVWLVGPFKFRLNIDFYQQYNTKTSFLPERQYIFSLRDQMTRVEKQTMNKLLRLRLFDESVWPAINVVAKNPLLMDSLQVVPVACEHELFNNGVVRWLEGKYSIEHNLGRSGKEGSAAVRMVPLEDSQIRYIIYYSLDRKGSTAVLAEPASKATHLLPGRYKAVVIWKDDHYSVCERVLLVENGTTLVSVSYGANKGPYDFIKQSPLWLSRSIGIDPDLISRWAPISGRSFQLEGAGSWGGIQGVLTDEKGNPLPSASVIVTQSGIQRGGTVTNFDGEYRVASLSAGRYDVLFMYQGIQQTVTGVIVNTGAISTVNNKLNTTRNVIGSKEVIIRASKPNVAPLIDAKRPGGRTTMTAEEIERLPTTNISDAASLPTQSYQSRSGIALGGSRGSGTQYIVDGVLVSGGHVAPTRGDVEAYYGGSGRTADKRTAAPGHYLTTEKSQGFINNFMANMMGASGMRKNFRDWAIWEPNLWTDSEGQTSFKVVYPDNMTSWKTYVLAMNRRKFSGKIVRLTRAFKPLSAQLSAPRFLRYGDTVEVIGKVANYTKQPFNLRYGFKLDNRPVAGDSQEVHNTKVVVYKAAAPVHNSMDTAGLKLSFQIEAGNGYQDGEEHIVPVLPVGVMETKGQFVTMTRDTVVSCAPDSNAGQYTGKVRVYMEGSLLEVMLRETEQLKVYPHGCNEQLTTKLLAIYYEEVIKKLLGSSGFNNTVAKRKILDQLVRAQRNDGGFGWWSNNDADYRVTNYIISTLQKINDSGWLDFVIRRGLDYLGTHVDYMDQQDQIATLSTLSDGRYPANFKPLLDKIDVRKASIYDRMAMVKIRKEQQLPYRKELDTLMRLRRESVRGTYWGAFNYDWYRDDLATTVLAYRVVKDDSVYHKLTPSITRYLMFQRRDGGYRNTASGGLVLSNLLPDLLSSYLPQARKKPTYVKISGTLNDSVTSFPKLYELKQDRPVFHFEKKGINPVYVSVVYNYFNINPVRQDSDFVVHTYFLDAKHDTVSSLKAGEKVLVRTVVQSRKDAEYVMISVPVPAGCVAADKKSSYPTYPEASREHFKDQTYIYCNRLNKGTYSFDVVLEARYKGTYNLSPARAGMMYYPGESGHTEVTKIRVE